MRTFLLSLLLLGMASGQERFKFCAPNTITDGTCYSLQRGDSQVSCVRVEDSAECAIKLFQGDADFGVFNAEELFLAYHANVSGVQLVSQLKHSDRITEDFEFQSVAVVSANFTPGSFDDLKSGGLCHPGFSKSQHWTDYVLKFFEKKLYTTNCQADKTAAESEAESIKNYFGNACRPGDWVADSTLDRTLKDNYPELCALCDDVSGCKYTNTGNHGHTGALDCLTSGRGKVAYAALSYVRQYFGISESPGNVNSSADNYRILCSDGNLDSLSSPAPCAWVKQPWSAIVARDDRAAQLLEGLKVWLGDVTERSSQDWTIALNSILQRDAKAVFFTEYTSLASYVGTGRELTSAANTKSCGNNIRWCTLSALETNKCNWVAKAAFTHGIEPQVSCVQANSTFHCFHDIANNTADIITIDSNYGHFARQVFNLSTVLYSETDNDKSSVVIAVVREGASYNVTSFSSLSKRSACFPEYGGIAWLSFVNVARTHGIISDSCDYPAEVASLLSAACTPGAQDTDHSNSTTTDASSTLCSLCPVEANNATCSANSSNIYFGDKGALECLNSGAGDIAFIEAKNLLEHVSSGMIDASKYRVLCKNSTLALNTGFNVDDLCALSVTIDSEVVGRRSNSEINRTDTTMALLKMEDWLGYRTDSLRPIHIYGPFNGTKDLLFKDSTSGLESTSSTVRLVLAYKELFSHVEACSGASAMLASFSITLLTILFAFYAL